MVVLNREGAELFAKTERMKLEATTMRPTGVKFLQQANRAMVQAKAKAVANERSGTGKDGTVSAVGHESSEPRRGTEKGRAQASKV